MSTGWFSPETRFLLAAAGGFSRAMVGICSGLLQGQKNSTRTPEFSAGMTILSPISPGPVGLNGRTLLMKTTKFRLVRDSRARKGRIF
jgi:hypothetical protein